MLLITTRTSKSTQPIPAKIGLTEFTFRCRCFFCCRQAVFSCLVGIFDLRLKMQMRVYLARFDLRTAMIEHEAQICQRSIQELNLVHEE